MSRGYFKKQFPRNVLATVFRRPPPHLSEDPGLAHQSGGWTLPPGLLRDPTSHGLAIDPGSQLTRSKTSSTCGQRHTSISTNFAVPSLVSVTWLETPAAPRLSCPLPDPTSARCQLPGCSAAGTPLREAAWLPSWSPDILTTVTVLFFLAVRPPRFCLTGSRWLVICGDWLESRLLRCSLHLRARTHLLRGRQDQRGRGPLEALICGSWSFPSLSLFQPLGHERWISNEE